MSNEVDLSFLKIPELLTKTVYDTNGDGVVDGKADGVVLRR